MSKASMSKEEFNDLLGRSVGAPIFVRVFFVGFCTDRTRASLSLRLSVGPSSSDDIANDAVETVSGASIDRLSLRRFDLFATGLPVGVAGAKALADALWYNTGVRSIDLRGKEPRLPPVRFGSPSLTAAFAGSKAAASATRAARRWSARSAATSR